MLQTITPFVRLINHQPAVLFSQNKSATSNQPAVLFSQNKPAPATSQTNRLDDNLFDHVMFSRHVLLFYPDPDEDPLFYPAADEDMFLF
jgi:hypothetical protein